MVEGLNVIGEGADGLGLVKTEVGDILQRARRRRG